MVEPPPHKKDNLRRQVMLTLALGVLLALLLAGSIAARHGLFSRHVEVYFLADSGSGISPGISVRLSGFRIGSVSAVELQDDLKVRVTMKIEEERFASLRRDAHAEWFKEQLAAAVIDLDPGKAQEPLSRADPRVTHSRRRTLTEVANDLRARLAPNLDDVKQLTGAAAARKDDIGAVLANARTTTEQLAATTAELKALAGNARGRVNSLGEQAGKALGQVQGALGQVNQSLVKLDGVVVQARGTLDGVNGRLPTLLGGAQDTLDQVNGLVRELRAVSAAASATLPGVIRSTGPMVEDTREMIGGVRNAWPVKNLVAPPPPALVPLDSHDAATLRGAHGR